VGNYVVGVFADFCKVPERACLVHEVSS